MIKMLVNEIKDVYLINNFERLNKFFLEENILSSNFRHFEITFTGAVTNLQTPHNLGFKPKDIIQTSKTGTGAITFNYDKFTQLNFDITTTGACVVRFFAGTYENEAL